MNKTEAEMIRSTLLILIEMRKKDYERMLAYENTWRVIVDKTQGEFDVAGLIDEALSSPEIHQKAQEKYGPIELLLHAATSAETPKTALDRALRELLTLETGGARPN